MKLFGPAPLSRLTPVQGVVSGTIWDSGTARAEVVEDGDGGPLVWRLWTRTIGGRWEASSWDLRTTREQLRRNLSGDAA